MIKRIFKYSQSNVIASVSEAIHKNHNLSQWIAASCLRTPRNDFKRVAFTLAEVLITLTIIGVIAALTIPNLMKNYKNHVTVTKVQKAYNMIQRMAINIKTNTNCNDLECTGLLDIPSAFNTTKDVTEKFIEYAGIQDSKIYSAAGGGYKLAKALCDNCTTSYKYNYYFTTQDNMSYMIRLPNTQGEAVAMHPEKSIMVSVSIANPQRMKSGDVVLGRDIFVFIMLNDFSVESVVSSGFKHIYPSSYASLGQTTALSQASIVNNCNPPNDYGFVGYSCAARILLDGWKIKY